MKTKFLTTAVALGLALSFSTHAAEAQGKGKAKQQRDRDRTEEIGIYDPSWPVGDHGRTTARGNGSGKVPPGWCQGVGNPHNTPENCGYGSRSVGTRYPTDGRGGSYEQAHADFHRQLDDYYNRLAAQRPLDVQYQLELRMRKRAEHDEWHRRMGIAH